MEDSKYIINFIDRKQSDFSNFLKIYSEEFKKNNNLQAVYFLNAYNPFISNSGFNIEQLVHLVKLNTNKKWIQIFDDRYVGFLKQNLDMPNNHQISTEEKQKYFLKITNFRDSVIRDFFTDLSNTSLYDELSNFKEIETEKHNSIRDTILYNEDLLKNNSKTAFKPLNINNWVLFYENIFKSEFKDFNEIKNNSDIIILEKKLYQNLIIEIQMDKKNVSINLKTDSLTIPNCKTFIKYHY